MSVNLGLVCKKLMRILSLYQNILFGVLVESIKQENVDNVEPDILDLESTSLPEPGEGARTCLMTALQVANDSIRKFIGPLGRRYGKYKTKVSDRRKIYLKTLNPVPPVFLDAAVDHIVEKS
ncbi:hypothetical protein FGB62_206g01 [Gracilaria domingensis]|nr:hypothetical protein FGB62_416g02 [Gracilaria domingensis]KAI0558496.1 hypothetical protein FGB62_206g01 [Gracilaria domingensis]